MIHLELQTRKGVVIPNTDVLGCTVKQSFWRNNYSTVLFFFNPSVITNAETLVVKRRSMIILEVNLRKKVS